MIAGIVTLAGSLVGLLFWALQRHAATADNPKTQILAAYDENRKAIANGTADERLEYLLTRLSVTKS